MTQTFADTANTDPQATSEPQDSGTQAPTQPDQGVALIVGERAFKTMDDVKTKIENADSHIGNIESENADLRTQIESLQEQLNKIETMKDLLDKGNSDTPNVDVAELVRKEVNTLRQEDTRESNISNCMKQAKEAYGENFIESISKTAEELGMSIDGVDKMAAESPKLFAKTFLPENKPATGMAHKGTINTIGLQEAPEAPKKDILSMSSKERTEYLVQQLEAASKQT